jgi:1-acyl-sn-glycerol-3-phosphate acyltransferase
MTRPHGQTSEAALAAGAGTGLRSTGGIRVTAVRRVERGLRVVGTGFMFATFGVGAVLLATVVVPVLALLRGRTRAPDLLAQRVIHHTFRCFVGMGGALRLMSLAEEGTERLREGGTLVVANHPTLLDVVYLISRMPQADCVVKAQAWANPALRGIVKVAGYLPNRDPEHMISACAERLAAGRSIVIFPEGSRSPAAGLGHFHRGFAHMALRSGAKVLPVTITCDPPALKRGQPWYKLPNARLDFRLEVGQPIDVSRVAGDGAPRGVAARRLTAMLRTYFELRLTRGST